MDSWRWESEWGSCYEILVMRIHVSTPAGQKTCLHVHGVRSFLFFWRLIEWYQRLGFISVPLNTVVEVGISKFMKLYFSPFGYVEKMEGKFGHTFSSLISKFKSHLLWSEIWWDLEDIPNPSFIFLSFQLHTGKIYF